jgi:YD repeat-containing protein
LARRQSATTAWTWSAGRITGLTTPSGRTIAYSRDASGRISEVRLTDSAPAGDGRTRVIASDIRYHPFGGLKSYRDGAGQTHTRHQDQDGRIASYTLGSQNWLLSYDAAGRIGAQFDAANAAQSATYGYDGLDRLTSASLPNTAYGYTWDATGNRTSHTLGSTTRNYTLDPLSNRLQSVGSVPPRNYSHDANGSITSDGAHTYVYDGKGRLMQTSTRRRRHPLRLQRPRRTHPQAQRQRHHLPLRPRRPPDRRERRRRHDPARIPVARRPPAGGDAMKTTEQFDQPPCRAVRHSPAPSSTLYTTSSTKPYVVMEALQNAKTSLARFRKMLFGASTESKDNC